MFFQIVGRRYCHDIGVRRGVETLTWSLNVNQIIQVFTPEGASHSQPEHKKSSETLGGETNNQSGLLARADNNAALSSTQAGVGNVAAGVGDVTPRRAEDVSRGDHTPRGGNLTPAATQLLDHIGVERIKSIHVSESGAVTAEVRHRDGGKHEIYTVQNAEDAAGNTNTKTNTNLNAAGNTANGNGNAHSAEDDYTRHNLNVERTGEINDEEGTSFEQTRRSKMTDGETEISGGPDTEIIGDDNRAGQQKSTRPGGPDSGNLHHNRSSNTNTNSNSSSSTARYPEHSTTSRSRFVASLGQSFRRELDYRPVASSVVASDSEPDRSSSTKLKFNLVLHGSGSSASSASSSSLDSRSNTVTPGIAGTTGTAGGTGMVTPAPGSSRAVVALLDSTTINSKCRTDDGIIDDQTTSTIGNLNVDNNGNADGSNCNSRTTALVADAFSSGSQPSGGEMVVNSSAMTSGVVVVPQVVPNVDLVGGSSTARKTPQNPFAVLSDLEKVAENQVGLSVQQSGLQLAPSSVQRTHYQWGVYVNAFQRASLREMARMSNVWSKSALYVEQCKKQNLKPESIDRRCLIEKYALWFIPELLNGTIRRLTRIGAADANSDQNNAASHSVNTMENPSNLAAMDNDKRLRKMKRELE